MYAQLVNNKSFCILALCILTVVFCLIAVKIMQTIGMEKVRKTVYRAFIEAENRFRYGENRSKFNYVVDVAKKSIPAPFNLFITEDLIRDVIQLWFDLCKDLLDDGRMNGTGDNSDNTNKKGQ